jgi:hypothetical protein
MAKHLVIPDVQAKPGHDFTFLNYIGRYICEKRPDVIVCIGDMADLPSLSSYDVGKKSFEGRRYKADIEAVHQAMEALLSPLKELNDNAVKNHKPRYRPRMILTLGNHEIRINRVVESDPKLDGTICISDLGYEEAGWEVYDFLDVVTVDGVAYSHYFTSGVMGRPVASARALVQKKHMSAVMGHVQLDQIYSEHTADGRRITGIFAGCCYEHNEDYLGAQGNNYWRGIWMLHDVKDGEFEPMQVSLKYLRSRYG